MGTLCMYLFIVLIFSPPVSKGIQVNFSEFKNAIKKRAYLESASEMHIHMHEAAERSRRITADINGGRVAGTVFHADRAAGGQNVRAVSAVLRGLRAEHHSGQKCLHQFGVLFSRPRRN